jgi:hypothetical protein
MLCHSPTIDPVRFDHDKKLLLPTLFATKPVRTRPVRTQRSRSLLLFKRQRRLSTPSSPDQQACPIHSETRFWSARSNTSHLLLVVRSIESIDRMLERERPPNSALLPAFCFVVVLPPAIIMVQLLPQSSSSSLCCVRRRSGRSVDHNILSKKPKKKKSPKTGQKKPPQDGNSVCCGCR